MRGNTRPTGRRRVVRRSATLTRWAWWIHGIVGLKLGLVVTFVVITGTLATLGHEWDWLFGPYQRVSPDGDRAGLAEIYSAVDDAYPEHFLLQVHTRRGHRTAASVIAVSPDRQYRRIYVDPYRTTQIWNTDMLSAQMFLRQVHQSLLIPKYGRLFVSGLSLLTLISLVSGLVVYKRFWRGFLVIPRRRNLRTFLGDCHRLAGVWSIWFLAIITITSLWYLYEDIDTFGAHLDTPGLSEAALTTTGAKKGERISVENAVNAAREAVPDLDPQRLLMPEWADEPIVVQGFSGAWLVRPRATSVAVDPYSGDIIHLQLAGELGFKARLHEAADPLHFGTFGGLTTKLVWFIFGIAMSFLSISGLIIYAKRLVHRSSSRNRPASGHPSGGKGTGWDAGVT